MKKLSPFKKHLKHSEHPKPRAIMARTSKELGLELNDVVVVFAASDSFVPYLSVAIQSILENASSERTYDIVVLTRDLTPNSMLTLTSQVNKENTHIGFLDVEELLHNITLPHHGHFRPETYFRLLAPTFLPNVDKAVYLDSDLVVLDDIAKLFDTNLEDKWLAATQDADTLGQIDGYDPLVKPYLAQVLKLDDPYTYFQAGVLVMNLQKFRENTTPESLLDLALTHTWHWLDQDILNRLVQNDYVRVPMRWNYLVDWQGLRRHAIVGCAEQTIVEQYEQARTNIGIVHYAGPHHRPWHYPNCDLSGYFWYYAQKSPYYTALLAELEIFTMKPEWMVSRVRAWVSYRAIMPFVNKTCPPGTKRRKAVIASYAKITKQCY